MRWDSGTFHSVVMLFAGSVPLPAPCTLVHGGGGAMSAKLMGLVFELAIPLKPKMVLLKYAGHADPDGCNAWPSVKTVARGRSIPERTTARPTDKLRGVHSGRWARRGSQHLGIGGILQESGRTWYRAGS